MTPCFSANVCTCFFPLIFPSAKSPKNWNSAISSTSAASSSSTTARPPPPTASASGRAKALHPLLRGGAAQGASVTCGLAGVLPPWHNGCHGSRVWCDFLLVDVYRPPFGGMPHGSGAKPLLDCAAEPRRGVEGHATCPGFYRRSATGLAAHRSGVDSLFINIEQTAVGRQALQLAKKASVDLNPRWPFALQKYPSCGEVLFQAALFAYG